MERKINSTDVELYQASKQQRLCDIEDVLPALKKSFVKIHLLHGLNRIEDQEYETLLFQIIADTVQKHYPFISVKTFDLAFEYNALGKFGEIVSCFGKLTVEFIGQVLLKFTEYKRDKISKVGNQLEQKRLADLYDTKRIPESSEKVENLVDEFVRKMKIKNLPEETVKIPSHKNFFSESEKVRLKYDDMRNLYYTKFPDKDDFEKLFPVRDYAMKMDELEIEVNNLP